MAESPTTAGALEPRQTLLERLQEQLHEIGIPRLLIAGFLVFLFAMAVATKMEISRLVTDSILRVGRNALLVLALLPAIQGGVGLNFGLPLGIVCGLVGLVTTMNLGITGWVGLGGAAAIGIVLATPAGMAYGWLLNRTRGQEMMVGTYLGFAVVSGMSIFWVLAPYTNPQLVWAIGGKGLRTTLTLADYYDQILDNLWSFQFLGLTIPTGTFILIGLIAAGVSWFFRTRAGLTISAARSNPRFARAAGISDEKTRIQATTMSTVIAAVGIVVFAQSYGFVQLYTAPLLMAFPAVACILIGGASLQRATLMHVFIGTVLFQSILTVALPVTSQVIAGDISETARLIIQNGMILYALTRKLN